MYQELPDRKLHEDAHRLLHTLLAAGVFAPVADLSESDKEALNLLRMIGLAAQRYAVRLLTPDGKPVREGVVNVTGRTPSQPAASARGIDEMLCYLTEDLAVRTSFRVEREHHRSIKLQGAKLTREGLAARDATAGAVKRFIDAPWSDAKPLLNWIDLSAAQTPAPVLHAQTVNIQHVGQVRAETVNLPPPPGATEAQTSAEPDSPLDSWILKKLCGASLSADELREEAAQDPAMQGVSRSESNVKRAIRKLRKQKRIANNKKLGGYYRPDAPPRF